MGIVIVHFNQELDDADDAGQTMRDNEVAPKRKPRSGCGDFQSSLWDWSRGSPRIETTPNHGR